jgi:hypothetical protein
MPSRLTGRAGKRNGTGIVALGLLYRSETTNLNEFAQIARSGTDSPSRTPFRRWPGF